MSCAFNIKKHSVTTAFKPRKFIVRQPDVYFHQQTLGITSVVTDYSYLINHSFLLIVL